MEATENYYSVKLGTYRGLTASRPQITVTEEEIAAAFESKKEQLAERIEITDRGIQQGDIVTLDYTGLYHGNAYEGSQKQNEKIVIGQENFLAGFDEQLEAAETGDRMNITVTFPSDYRMKGLAGKEVLFKCLIRGIEEIHYPAFDDAMKEALGKELRQQKEEEAESELTDSLLAKIAEDSEFDISDDLIEQAVENAYHGWTQMIREKGYDPEKYFKVMGSDEEKQKKRLRPEAILKLKGRLILEAIARQEQLAVTEADVDRQMDLIAAQLEMPKEVLKQRFDEETMACVREDALSMKAIRVILDSAMYE